MLLLCHKMIDEISCTEQGVPHRHFLETEAATAEGIPYCLASAGNPQYTKRVLGITKVKT